LTSKGIVESDDPHETDYVFKSKNATYKSPTPTITQHENPQNTNSHANTETNTNTDTKTTNTDTKNNSSSCRNYYDVIPGVAVMIEPRRHPRYAHVVSVVRIAWCQSCVVM
jgi:hypothetical protein